MEDNFDKKIRYYCKVSYLFIVGNMSPKCPSKGLNLPVQAVLLW